MISYFISLIEAWLPIWQIYLVDFFCLGIIGFVGFCIHFLLRR